MKNFGHNDVTVHFVIRLRNLQNKRQSSWISEIPRDVGLGLPLPVADLFPVYFTHRSLSTFQTRYFTELPKNHRCHVYVSPTLTSSIRPILRRLESYELVAPQSEGSGLHKREQNVQECTDPKQIIFIKMTNVLNQMILPDSTVQKRKVTHY